MIDNEFLRAVYMREVVVKRTLKKAVEERAKSCTCLIQDCNARATRRGLCDPHYQQWYTRLRGQESKSGRARFEANCIIEGLILPPGKQRQLQTNDPFTAAEAG